ncbi:MAG TPA: hypothetical protein VMH91_00425 [Candidatus Paceibacterota bacterium]|nr:hypothetical protein [Candidatus Paceibacterota bacterium]
MNSETRSPYIIGGLVVIALVALVAYLSLRGNSNSGNPAQSSATSTTTSSTSTTVSNLGYTITQVPISNPAPAKAPSYNGAIACPSTMSQEQCLSIQSRDATIIAALNADVTDAPAWIELGTLREETGDYAGAAAAWNYVIALYPNKSSGYYNLGDLYLNYVRDYPKAEANYLLALKYAPQDTSIYVDLFTLYTTTSYKPTATSAEDILKQGITANPKAVNLQVLLARYYRTLGRSADASAEYNAAIQNAQSQGQASLAQQIQAEANGQ